MNKTIPLKIKVEVRGDELTIDYSEVSEQVPGFINCGSSGGMAAARVAFKALTSPQREVNEGSFLALKVILPPGKLLSARRPAPIGGWSLSLPTVLDTIFRALRSGDAGPRAGGAQGRHGRLRDLRHEFEDRPALRLPEYHWRRLGRPALRGRCFFSRVMCQGDVKNTPIELQELYYPLLYECHAV
jgi:N-methylhydantoinase B